MKDDVFERLRTADPATDERILREARALGDVAGRIASSEPTIVHRFPKTVRRQGTLVAVAAVVVVAIVLPLTLLRSLGDGGGTAGDDTGDWVTVGTLAEVNARGVMYVPTPGATTAAGAFVMARDGQDPLALSAVPMEGPREATGERVVYCPGGPAFMGSSGDSYLPTGDVMEGSVDHGLSPMLLRVLDGSVQIDPSHLDPGSTTRGQAFRVPCESVQGVPLEGAPGFGIPRGTPLPPIAVALPQSGMTLFGSAHVVGSADVFEATVSVRILDERGEMIAESFTTATCGTGCRGDYAADVPFAVDHRQRGTVQVFESSAKDGSMINTVEIPVTLAPGLVPDAPGVEGVWFDGNGAPLPDGSANSAGTVLVVFRGAEQCQWETASFMHLGWPVGTVANGLEDWRQYVRDPRGLFDDGALHVGYLGDTSLPADAADTGYHRGSWHLFVSPSEADEAVYVFNGNTGAVERWGRATDVILCK